MESKLLELVEEKMKVDDFSDILQLDPNLPISQSYNFDSFAETISSFATRWIKERQTVPLIIIFNSEKANNNFFVDKPRKETRYIDTLVHATVSVLRV